VSASKRSQSRGPNPTPVGGGESTPSILDPNGDTDEGPKPSKDSHLKEEGHLRRTQKSTHADRKHVQAGGAFVPPTRRRTSDPHIRPAVAAASKSGSSRSNGAKEGSTGAAAPVPTSPAPKSAPPEPSPNASKRKKKDRRARVGSKPAVKTHTVDSRSTSIGVAPRDPPTAPKDEGSCLAMGCHSARWGVHSENRRGEANLRP